MPNLEQISSDQDDLMQSSGKFDDLNSASYRTLGAIDIGTNSIHLVIASVDLSLNSFKIEIAEKSSTRLGEREIESGDLTEIAMERSIDALRRFKEIASSHKVEKLLTAATSAVREAPNGRLFLQRIRRQLSLDVELVSGPEEARLIYLGVLSGMPFGDRPHFLLDIGGGSTELILADGRDARALTSTRVGAVQLKTDFIKSEPIPPKRLEFLKTFVQGSLEPAVNKVMSRIDFDEKPLMVATSGTAMAIGALVSFEKEHPPFKLQGYRVSRRRLNQLVDKLYEMSPEERRAIPSLNSRRAEIIVPGALILQTAMHMLSMDELVLSERALREGLIVDWMLRNKLSEDRFDFQSSIRHRTVIHQLKRFSVNQSRAESVAKHSLSFYDQTYGVLHNDDGKGRELLWAAAMLHSSGQHINLSGYHKHSWYLIRYGELLGYSHAEHLMVAAIARYHRRSLPKKRHSEWQGLLSNENRKLVFDMSILLRLSAALDRRPDPAVASVKAGLDKNELVIRLFVAKPNINIELEKWSLENCSAILEEQLGIKLRVVLD